MNINDINRILAQLAAAPTRENVLEFAFALLQWMSIEPNAGRKPQLLSPQTQKLKDYLVPAPFTVQPQIYRLSADNQNIRVRFAVLKKLKKDYISQLVDNDPGLSSYQSFIKGLTIKNGTGFIPAQPYFIHFVTTPDYDRLVFIFNQGDQKRIVSFRKRLTNTQYNKIILQWQGIGTRSKPEIADIFWKSLDIKEVNKEFYRQIKERFDALLGILSELGFSRIKDDRIDNLNKQFTVRFLGRYIFCWFLKEKNQNDVSVIPYELISSNEIKKYKAEGKSFYHDRLLKLFFGTLNTLVQNRDWLMTEPVDTKKLFERIPYLNGGLFDDNNDEDHHFNSLQFDINDWLIKFVEILESYDFTVDESSSQYQQVAVDPEMLGRIFENLLASQNEETSAIASQRKAYGAFYTPREIVDYMANESIKAYLQTQWEQQLKEEKTRIEKAIGPLFAANPVAGHLKKEEKNLLLRFLEQIKILDPACGSGAFPMGILLRLVELHELLGTVKSSYELKKDILSKNIYGVDIMPMAIEIARLRAWLSLVLEENYNSRDPVHNYGVKPLPNLDFKFVCANSLIDLGLDNYLKEANASFYGNFAGELIKRLQQLETIRKDYFLPDLSAKEKESIKTKFLQERDNLLDAILVDDKQSRVSEPGAFQDEKLKQIALKLKQWNPFDDSCPSPFFSPAWMFGIENGFDVVIGNPPYVQIQKLSGQPIQKLLEEQHYETFNKTGDLYCLFYERGYQVLKRQGNLNFITSNKWMRANYGEKLRGFFVRNTNPRILIDFGGYDVFESVTVDTNIFIFEKDQNNSKHLIACTINKEFKEETSIPIFVNSNSFVLNKLSSDTWEVSSTAEYQIKKRIESKGIPLKDWNISLNRGILTGFNEAFIINAKKKDELIGQDIRNAEIIKPILRGRDIKRYNSEFAGLWLINAHNGYKSENGERIECINVEKDYPLIYNHLQQYQDKLEPRADQGAHWTNLRNCAYITSFEVDKITWGNLALSSQFAFVKAGYFINAPSPLITPANKYILAILNSKLGDYYIRSLGVTRNGGYFEYKPMFIEKIPIPQISKDKQLPFEILVDEILKRKKAGQDTTALEREIDLLVFALYDLTIEEVHIIDKTVNKEEYRLIRE